MQKRGKIRELKGITIQFPSSSRILMCRVWGQVGWGGPAFGQERWPRMGWIQHHHLKDGDTLIVCAERGCRTMICQDHHADHIQEHMLTKLEGEKK